MDMNSHYPKVSELQDITLPRRSLEIAAICGQAVPYEVDWASIANDAKALSFLDNLACHRLNLHLRLICADDHGRDAVRQGLKLVRLRNVSGPKRIKVRLSDGVLDLHFAFGWGPQGAPSAQHVREVLIAALGGVADRQTAPPPNPTP